MWTLLEVHHYSDSLLICGCCAAFAPGPRRNRLLPEREREERGPRRLRAMTMAARAPSLFARLQRKYGPEMGKVDFNYGIPSLEVRYCMHALISSQACRGLPYWSVYSVERLSS